MKKIIYGIVISLLLLIVILNMFSVMDKALFGFRVFKVATGSMEPYLKVNDRVLIKESNDYKVNDVVTFIDKNGQYVTHRIIKIDDKEVITKGDSNNTEDEPIVKNNIVGKVILRFKLINFVFYLFSDPISWILLFGIGVFVIILTSKEK